MSSQLSAPAITAQRTPFKVANDLHALLRRDGERLANIQCVQTSIDGAGGVG
jgi:hypothetical protein